ncbi:MAG: hypothetical protein KME06_13400 [Kastovskya adunca ATA6-11-RM4]|jgi:hypothetical protein|nr:hypothetical protein [Kastovskya adunca ATA6-11-RM4]
MQDINATSVTSRRSRPWWEKLIALIAVVNLVLVLFSLSYVPLRDLYLQELPGVVRVVDPIKGIEPNPVTEEYLETVDVLERQLTQVGVEAPATEAILAELREDSEAMMDENPFLVAAKFGTFATIQRLMRHHLGTETARAAFERFWSAEYLLTSDWVQELSFFDHQIRPLIATNYYRSVDDYGRFIDEFWRIDIFFVSFFAIEFLVRSFFVSLRHSGVTWFDAMWRRWYDVFLFLPFWRGLRVLPVVVRLYQAGLLNLERVLAQIIHEPSTLLADRVSTFVAVRLINQAQDSLETGRVAQALLYPRDYLTVNEVNEVEVVTDRLLQLTIYKVLPKVQPNLEALMHHSLEEAFRQSDLYRTLQRIPGIANASGDVIEQLATSLAQASVGVLASSYSDEKGRKIFEDLTKNFSEALRLELRDGETLQELQSLLSDFLEEVKLNYVIRATKEDPETTMEEVAQLMGEAMVPKKVSSGLGTSTVNPPSPEVRR